MPSETIFYFVFIIHDRITLYTILSMLNSILLLTLAFTFTSKPELYEPSMTRVLGLTMRNLFERLSMLAIHGDISQKAMRAQLYTYID
jgi:hypothetical protein